ncbi:MAG: response regulator [Candidatus Aminicenantes bacterium]|nr:response regulator [Candidatus Aminicenantes bacterium]
MERSKEVLSYFKQSKLRSIFDRVISVTFRDPESIRLGQLFNTLMVISIGLLITLNLMFLALYVFKLDSALKLLVAAAFPIMFIPIAVFCVIWVKRGHLHFAISFYVWVNFLAIALAVVLFEGVNSPGTWLLFSWTIIISGALLIPRTALKMTLLVVVFFIVLLSLNCLGIYTPPLALSLAAQKIQNLSFMIITLVFSIGILSYLNMTSLKNTLKNLQQTKDDLNRERFQLQKEIQERKTAEKEKEKMQRYVQQIQKMESIGTLAGGIAHDFNNLLTGIKGRISLMLMNMDASDPHYQHIKEIDNYTESASSLTRQLLGFARGGKYDVKPTDVNELVKKQSQMFARTRKQITLHEDYGADIWTVEVDRSQIQQAILNLLVNASHAMPGGGDIYIKTMNTEMDEKVFGKARMIPGRYVRISITDTGIGMDKATQQRVFDPFFTTKEMGRGLGMGLASTYGIIKNHSGYINVYSEKGEGSTFNMYLPASDKKIPKTRDLPREIMTGAETILLVDDEVFILDVASSMLEKMGYRILSASNGESALDIYNKKWQDISLVILDLIMPNMNGGEIYDRLKTINPEAKVLLSSGYGLNGQAAEVMKRGCDGFIQKPFDIKELSRKVREIIEC